jgi:dihydrolipoamide dehydrogenase
VGCIPSKALLDSSQKYTEAQRPFAAHGIGDRRRRPLMSPAMLAQGRDRRQLTGGIAGLFKHNGVT